MPSIHPDQKFQYFNHLSNKKQITDILGKQNDAFSSNASLYCYLAAIGFKTRKRIKTVKNSREWGEVRAQIFSNQGLSAKIYTIALAETKDYSILKDEEACFKIFEEYVNSGFSEILKKSKKVDSEDDFIDMLLQEVREAAQQNITFEEDDDEVVVELDLEE